MLKRIAVTLALFICALVGSTNGRARDVAEVPSHVGEYLWLVELSAVPESPGVFDARVFKIYYDAATNRIVILGDDDGARALPTFSTAYDDIAAGSVALVDTDGNFDTTLSESEANPTFAFAGVPLPVTWPNMSNTPGGGTAPRIGDASVITSLQTGTARDGVTSTLRGNLNERQIEQCVSEDVQPNLHSSASQLIYDNDTGRRFILTKLVLRDPEETMNVAVTASIGTNSTDYDNIAAPRSFEDLVGAGDYLIWRPGDGAKVVEDGEAIYWNPSAAFTGTPSQVHIDIWGYYVD